jgi:hypothetical protein
MGLLGGCPRIAILFKIEKYLKKAAGIPTCRDSEDYFFNIMKSLGKRAFSESLLVSIHLS